MGNAEAKAISESSGTVDDDAVMSAHRQYLSYGDAFFPIDRSAFSLFFRKVPFAVVDQVYDALLAAAEKRRDAVLYRDLVLPLVVASTLRPKEKTRIIYDVFVGPSARAGAGISEVEVATRMATSLLRAVDPLRGEEDSSGRVQYPAFRCTGCRQVPTNLVFQCAQCPTVGSVVGVPASVLLCKGCANTWEGFGINHVRHAKEHKLNKLRLVPNPKLVSFTGTECAACKMAPIVGPRLRCLDCTDLSQLCAGCYSAGASPGAHRPSHSMESQSEAASLADEVARLLYELGFSLPQFDPAVIKSKWAVQKAKELDSITERNLIPKENPGGRPLSSEDVSSPEAFERWALGSERLLPLLGGSCTHYVPRCEHVELYERVETEVGLGQKTTAPTGHPAKVSL
jgi:hypothetical protein